MWPHVKWQIYQSQHFPPALTIEPCHFSMGTDTGREEVGFGGERGGTLSMTSSISHHFTKTALLWFVVHGKTARCDSGLRLVLQWLLYWRKETLGWMSPWGLVRSHHKFAFQLENQCVSIFGQNEWTGLAYGIQNRFKLMHFIHQLKFLTCVIGPSTHWHLVFMYMLSSCVMETFCPSCERVIKKEYLLVLLSVPASYFYWHFLIWRYSTVFW